MSVTSSRYNGPVLPHRMGGTGHSLDSLLKHTQDLELPSGRVVHLTTYGRGRANLEKNLQRPPTRKNLEWLDRRGGKL